MNSNAQSSIKTGSTVAIAYAVVVLTSYFITFSTLQDVSFNVISWLVLLGIAYIAIGTYGYSYCARSEHPFFHLGYFFLQIPLGGLIVYLSRGTGFNAMILLPLASHSVMVLSQNWMYAVNAAILFSYVISMLLVTKSWAGVWAGLPSFLAGQIFIIAFTQMAINEEKARISVEKLVVELENANQQLRDFALKIEELTLTRERNRLAREIHDGLGHYLTTIHMQLQAAKAILTTNPQRAKDTLSSAQDLTQEALEDVRRSVNALRLLPEETLSLPERIAKIIVSYEIIGIVPELSIVGSPRPLPAQTELVIFRAAQEGLSNACKHAQATRVWVMLDYTKENEVKLIVRDNGMGANQLSDGFGLRGLHERVSLINGELNITNIKDQGFILEIVVPG